MQTGRTGVGYFTHLLLTFWSPCDFECLDKGLSKNYPGLHHLYLSRCYINTLLALKMFWKNPTLNINTCALEASLCIVYPVLNLFHYSIIIFDYYFSSLCWYVRWVAAFSANFKYPHEFNGHDILYYYSAKWHFTPWHVRPKMCQIFRLEWRPPKHSAYN